jgi:pimeloyl-ACP methyl ester carboxylesterase
MGGYVGLAFARKYSQYLKGLCLFHSTALPDTEERKLVREKAIKVVKHNKNRYIKEMIYGLFAPELRNFFKKAILLTIRNAQKTSKQGIIAAIEGMKIRPSSEDVLQAIQVPVGFIAGKKDIGIPYESIQKQAKLPKVVRAIYLNEVAHMGHIEEPEACLKFLNQFITLCKKYKP